MPKSTVCHHLPDVPDPKDTICFQVQVPNDPWHVRAFLGQLQDLASAWAWCNDDAHTALICASVWAKIVRNLYAGCPIPDIGGGDSDEDGDMLRVNPDDPCELQVFCAGNWEHFWSVSDCGSTQTTQPGPAGPGPGPGLCADYPLSLDAAGKTLLPITVSEGDTVQALSAQGGWNDGGSSWYCPDGSGYIAGLCIDYCGDASADPLTTGCHMQLIAEVDGVFYDAIAGFTVPSGLTAVNCTFQANDPTLSDNFGSIQFKAHVCRAEASSFEHVFDFSGGPLGWTADPPGFCTGAPFWSGGAWRSDDCNQTTCGGDDHTAVMQIIRTIPATRTITYVEVIGTCTADHGPGGAREIIYDSSVVNDGTQDSVVGAIDFIQLGSRSISTKLEVVYNSSCFASAQPVAITKVIVRGLGSDPWV